MSEKNLIPELRFPAFEKDGEWTVSSIDKLCDILNNIRKPVTSTNRTAGPYPYYGASGIIDFIDKFLFDERLLLIGEDGAKWGAYDNTAFLVEGKYWVNNHAHVLKPIGIDEKLLESYLVKLDLNPYITGAAPPKLTLRKLKEIPVPVPSTPEEQQKIASCLSSLDELIAAHKDKLDALKDHKKGLLQNLFPQEGETVPKLRFPEFEEDGEWELKPFSKFIKLYRGSSPRPIREYLTKEETGVNWIKIGDTSSITDFVIRSVSEKITPKGAEKSRRVKKGELILANSMSYGSTYLLEVEGCIYDGWFVLREYEEHFDKQFLLQLLNSEYTQGQYKRFAAGGIVQNISSEIVYSITLSKTSKEEQQKIASCLSAVDELITAQQDKIEQLQQHKKGLMQGLFPKIND